MDRIRFATALFVIFLVFDVSSSAFHPKFRKLADSDSETSKNSSTQETPIPSNAPVPGANLLNSSENGGKSSANKSEDAQVSAPPKAEAPNAPEPRGDLPISKQSEEKDKQLSPPPADTEKKDKQLSPPPNNTKESEGQSSPPATSTKEADTKLSPPKTNITKENATQLSPPPASTKETDKQLSPEEKGTDKKLTPPREKCDGKRIRCQIPNTISACVQNSEFESKEWVIVVQNDVEEDLKVNLIVPTSVEDYKKEVSVPKHQIKEINVPRPSRNITLSTKKHYCNLELDQPTQPQAIGDWMLHLPTTELLTPINGAYLLIFTVVSLGGVWICCKCRKRKRHDSVGYQELQMASPETAAVVVDSAEGWDQVWDDEWDEESAVKSPGHRISANGLTSRTAKKDDGWEDDWDA